MWTTGDPGSGDEKALDLFADSQDDLQTGHHQRPMHGLPGDQLSGGDQLFAVALAAAGELHGLLAGSDADGELQSARHEHLQSVRRRGQFQLFLGIFRMLDVRLWIRRIGHDQFVG